MLKFDERHSYKYEGVKDEGAWQTDQRRLHAHWTIVIFQDKGFWNWNQDILKEKCVTQHWQHLNCKFYDSHEGDDDSNAYLSVHMSYFRFHWWKLAEDRACRVSHQKMLWSIITVLMANEHYKLRKNQRKQYCEHKETCSWQPLQCAQAHVRPEDRQLYTEKYCYHILWQLSIYYFDIVA